MSGIISANAQTITTDTINSRKTVTPFSTAVKNVVVADSGDLTIESLTTITIEGNFEVKLGGRLSIGITEPVTLRFDYDNSGNRVAKKPQE